MVAYMYVRVCVARLVCIHNHDVQGLMSRPITDALVTQCKRWNSVLQLLVLCRSTV